jgi:Ca2+-binding RTX toxin-like protein
VEGSDGDDVLTGYEDDDLVVGGSGNDVLSGGSGADVLDGGDGDDLLDGGPGADVLSGGTGGDLYVFGLGSGSDTIWETDSGAGSVDRIRMTPETSASDVRVTRTLDDLRIFVGGEGDCVTVANWFVADTYRVEKLEFADEATWDVPILLSLAATPTAADDFLVGGADDEDLAGLEGDDVLLGFGGKDLLEGGPGHDTLDGGHDKDELLGGAGNDRLLGGEGKDKLLGDSGDDHLDGGPGDDDLVGGDGSDVYKFEPGGGRDRIFEAVDGTGGWDCLDIGATPLGIQFEASGSKLDVRLAGTGDVVEVDSWNQGAVPPVEEFRSLDGLALHAAQVDRLIEAMAAFSVETGLTWAEAVRDRPEDVEAVLAQHWSPMAS